MNLSDTSIRQRFDELFPKGKGANDSIDPGAVQPSTVDLRLGSSFYTMSKCSFSVVDPKKDNPANYFTETAPENGDFIIRPGSLVLATTMEVISIPRDLVAFVDGKSSYGRWGLVIHSTAGLIDSGFEGAITLEMSLLGSYALRLHPGDYICQVRFEKLDRDCSIPYGDRKRNSKYMGQETTTLSRLHQINTEELEILQDALSLVGVDVPTEVLGGWDASSLLAAERWASCCYLQASDNDIEIPDPPRVLEEFVRGK